MASGSLTNVKIVILGAGSVGKTCLIRRYTDGVFRESSGYQATIGGAFSRKSIKRGEDLIIFNVWDTAGQERFNALTKQFYRNADAAIICYDITDASSLQSLRYWVEEVMNHEPNCAIYICGTKKDLLCDMDRPVDTEVVMKFSEKIGALSTETSSKTGENVEELFETIATHMFESHRKSLEEDAQYELVTEDILKSNGIMKKSDSDDLDYVRPREIACCTQQ